MTNISILGEIHFPLEDLKRLNKHFPSVVFIELEGESQNALAVKSKNADAVLISPENRLSKEFFDKCPSLKYVGVCGTSMENIDRDAAAENNVRVTNVKDYGDEPTAEFIFMQLTSLLRGAHGLRWKKDPHELMNKKIGIIGMGALGRSVADLAIAYKMNVSYYSRSRKNAHEKLGVVYSELPELLRNNEIIVLCTPTNLEILNSKQFDNIKNGSILVQASMGDVFSREAFLQWISKDDNYAIFDYAAGERNFKAYHALPRVIFPKIIAGHSLETKHRLAKTATKNLQAYFDGCPQNLVD